MKYTIKDVEQVLKNQLDINQTIEIIIKDRKVYLVGCDGFNRTEIELTYTTEEYNKLVK